jgi:hypothetical protein
MLLGKGLKNKEAGKRLEKYGENEFVRGNITWP